MILLKNLSFMLSLVEAFIGFSAESIIMPEPRVATLYRC